MKPLIYITKFLGKDTSVVAVGTSSALALISLFYIYTLGSFFKVVIFPLQNRVTYISFFDAYVIDTYVDHIIIASATLLWMTLALKGKVKFPIIGFYGGMAILGAVSKTPAMMALLDIAALISFPLVMLFVIYNILRPEKKNLRNKTNSLIMNHTSFIAFVIGFLGIFAVSLPIFSIQTSSVPLRNYSYEIFILFGGISAILIVLLIFSLPLKLLSTQLMHVSIRIRGIRVDSFSSASDSIRSRTKAICLLFFVLLSITIGIIPHLPTINKDNQRIGADTDYYVVWVGRLVNSSSVQELIGQAFVKQNHGDRGLTLLFLFGLVKLTNGNPFSTFEHLPILLGPVLLLVVYFLTRELTSSDIASLLASFLTSVSFHTTIGIYGGFYANWFALTIGFLSILFLVRFLNRGNKMSLICYSILIMILLFSHVYTWTIFVLVIVIFLVASLKLKYYEKKRIALVAIVLVASFATDFVKMVITNSAGGIEGDIKWARLTNIGPEQFTQRWTNLSRTTYSFVGGQFNNMIILSLAIYWLYRSSLLKPESILILAFLSIGIIPFLIGDWIIQTRIFYDIPFQIPAALGLAYIKRWGNGLFLPICIWLLVISIRASSNFYLIPPPS